MTLIGCSSTARHRPAEGTAPGEARHGAAAAWCDSAQRATAHDGYWRYWRSTRWHGAGWATAGSSGPPGTARQARTVRPSVIAGGPARSHGGRRDRQQLAVQRCSTGRHRPALRSWLVSSQRLLSPPSPLPPPLSPFPLPSFPYTQSIYILKNIIYFGV